MLILIFFLNELSDCDNETLYIPSVHSVSSLSMGALSSKKTLHGRKNFFRQIYCGGFNDQNIPRRRGRLTNALPSNSVCSSKTFPNQGKIYTWRKAMNCGIVGIIQWVSLRLIVKRFKRSYHVQFFSSWPWTRIFTCYLKS